jgi:hypothetical protein
MSSTHRGPKPKERRKRERERKKRGGSERRLISY